jgi:integrase
MILRWRTLYERSRPPSIQYSEPRRNPLTRSAACPLGGCRLLYSSAARSSAVRASRRGRLSAGWVGATCPRRGRVRSQCLLSPKTLELYEGLLCNHLNPTFGDMGIGDIEEEHVRKWRAEQLKAGPKCAKPFGPVTVAKGYRLLRAILNTAVRDKRLKENPCQIEGADKETIPERPVLSVVEVFRLADAIAPHYRALILLATFGNMRWGELAGLRRRNVDLDAGTVRIDETVYQGVRPGRRHAALEGTDRQARHRRVAVHHTRRSVDQPQRV